MWLLIHILAAAGAFFFRFSSKFSKSTTPQMLDGKFYFERIRHGKNSKILLHRVGVKIDSIPFHLSKETFFDRFFKIIGFSAESQTGDEIFDRSIYIASDHMVFCKSLKKNEGLRNDILRLFDVGVKSLQSDGVFVFIESKNLINISAALPFLFKIASEIESISKLTPRWYVDKFFFRALVVEGVIWSIAALSLTYFIRYGLVPLHLIDSEKFISYGTYAALFLFVLLIAFIFILLEKSSRSHKILKESAILLCLSLTVFGFQTVDFINRTFDRSPVSTNIAVVTRHWKQSRVRGSPFYYLEASSNTNGQLSRAPLEVSQFVFNSLVDGSSIPIETRKGRLGIAWVQKINGIPIY